MTKKNIIIGLSAIAAGLELGRTIQNIRINRLKRKLETQRAEKELLKAEAEKFEEDLRHMKAMADIHEKYVSEAEKQHKIFESDMERLRNKIDEVCKRGEIKLKEDGVVFVNDLVDELEKQFTEADVTLLAKTSSCIMVLNYLF